MFLIPKSMFFTTMILNRQRSNADAVKRFTSSYNSTQFARLTFPHSCTRWKWLLITLHRRWNQMSI